jgi:hypothetical protein
MQPKEAEMKYVLVIVHVGVGTFLIVYGAVWGFRAETESDVGTAVALVGTGMALLILWIMVVFLWGINRLRRRLVQMQKNMDQSYFGLVGFFLEPVPVRWDDEEEDYCQSEEEG